jgi:hypothetical protein
MRMVIRVIVSRFDLKLDPSYNPQKWYEDMWLFCYYEGTVAYPPFALTIGQNPLVVPHPRSF